MYDRDNYNLYLMGKDKIERMYFDSHTSIRKVFLERMNRARGEYIHCSKNARIQFEEYMICKKYGIYHFIRDAKNSYIKSANEVKRAKRLYKYHQRQYDEVCNRLPNELLNMEIGKYE